MQLNESDKSLLCGIARESVAAAVAGETYVPDYDGSALAVNRGCFVTLKTGGRLRGCIGCFESPIPLYATVAEYARHSALDDPRFAGNRLKAAELDKLDIEISIISPLVPCRDPFSIRLGTDGIQVRKGFRSGVFLPQVAEETGWTLEEFWGHCCRDKAGLDWNAWREPGTTVMTFTAEVFDC